MQLTTVVAFQATLFWISVFGQEDELFSVGNTTLRGWLTVHGALLEYKQTHQFQLINHYADVISNLIHELKQADPVTHEMNVTCFPHQPITSNSDFELDLSIKVSRDFQMTSVTSPSFTRVTMDRLLRADETNPFATKFELLTDTTVIYLTGSITPTVQRFITNRRTLPDWHTDGYSEIEFKICNEIIGRINQYPLLRVIDVVCGLTAIDIQNSLGMAYLILPNDQLQAAGFELSYEAVGLAVQSAVLRRPLHRENMNYHCRLILPNFRSQVTYYLLRGRIEQNGVTLKYNSQGEAEEGLREIIEQICDMARAQTTSAEKLEGHSLNCTLKDYNTNTFEVTVLMAAYINGWSGNQIWSVAAARLPFTLSNGIINYRAHLIHNELLRTKPITNTQGSQ